MVITTSSHNREGGTTCTSTRSRYELTFVSRYVLTRVRADSHPPCINIISNIIVLPDDHCFSESDESLLVDPSSTL